MSTFCESRLNEPSEPCNERRHKLRLLWYHSQCQQSLPAPHAEEFFCFHSSRGK